MAGVRRNATDIVAAVDLVPVQPEPTGRSRRHAAAGQRLTRAELAYCASRQRMGEHVAAREAAKPAVSRVLGWPGAIPWAAVEILRGPSGAPVVVLGGDVSVWTGERGLPAPRVSLTHTGSSAAALAWLPMAVP